MERSQRERLTEELTLVLLYLTSFTEKQCPNVRMTDEGVEKAKELLEQIGPSLGFKKEDWGD